MGARFCVDRRDVVSSCKLNRRIFALEALEPRRLLSAFPTPFEQYVLELINRARANPGAEVTRLSGKTWGDDPNVVPGSQFPEPQTPDLNEGLPAGTIANTPKPPLAFNANLTQAARDYSTTLLTNQQQLTHTFNNTSPTSRAQQDGYSGQAGENLAIIGNSSALPIDTTSSEQLHDNLFVDNSVTGRGHRTNLLNDTSGYREIGIGAAASTDYTGFGSGIPNAVLLTEDFGVPDSSGPILTGVVITDNNSDNFYEPGEGVGNVTITATRASDSAVFTTTTWDAGGYSLPLSAGTYSVTATGGGLSNLGPANVTINSDNVEENFTAAAVANSAPVPTTEPLAQTVTLGTTATFTAAASGTPTPTIQWQVSVNFKPFTDIPGATSNTLSFTAQAADSGNRYRAMFTNSQGTSLSDGVTLLVNNGGAPLTASLSGTLPPAAVGGAKTTAIQSLTMTNNSGLPINGTVTVTLFVSHHATFDGSETQFATIPAHVKLGNGAGKTLPVHLKSFPAVADGTYFILARASEGGNTAEAASAGTVNLAAPFVNLSATNAISSASVTRGKKAVVSVTVTNSGNVAAKGLLAIGLSASADSSGTNPQSVGTLSKAINIKPNASKIVRLSVPVSLAIAPGSYFIVATIDPGNTFAEPTLADNTAVSGSALTIV